MKGKAQQWPVFDRTRHDPESKYKSIFNDWPCTQFYQSSNSKLVNKSNELCIIKTEPVWTPKVKQSGLVTFIFINSDYVATMKGGSEQLT